MSPIRRVREPDLQESSRIQLCRHRLHNYTIAGTDSNLVGGYHDAGDSDRNAYQLMVPIVLLTTYEVFPGLFTGNPAWGINWDQDTLRYGTETNDVNSCVIWGFTKWMSLPFIRTWFSRRPFTRSCRKAAGGSQRRTHASVN